MMNVDHCRPDSQAVCVTVNLWVVIGLIQVHQAVIGWKLLHWYVIGWNFFLCLLLPMNENLLILNLKTFLLN